MAMARGDNPTKTVVTALLSAVAMTETVPELAFGLKPEVEFVT
jgi:hypothetical protein